MATVTQLSESEFNIYGISIPISPQVEPSAMSSFINIPGHAVHNQAACTGVSSHAEYTALVATHNTCTATIADLRKQLEQAQASGGTSTTPPAECTGPTAHDEYNDLVAAHASCTSTISQLTNDKNTLTEELAQARQQVVALTQDKTDLEARIKELEDQSTPVTGDPADPYKGVYVGFGSGLFMFADMFKQSTGLLTRESVITAIAPEGDPGSIPVDIGAASAYAEKLASYGAANMIASYLALDDNKSPTYMSDGLLDALARLSRAEVINGLISNYASEGHTIEEMRNAGLL